MKYRQRQMLLQWEDANPAYVAELKKAGTLEKALDRQAERYWDKMEDLLGQGKTMQEAEEIVMPQFYIQRADEDNDGEEAEGLSF